MSASIDPTDPIKEAREHNVTVIKTLRNQEANELQDWVLVRGQIRIILFKRPSNASMSLADESIGSLILQ